MTDGGAAKAIFLEAIEIDDPVARAGFVADRCGVDETLRRRVQALLAADVADGALDQPIDVLIGGGPSDGWSPARDDAPRSIGRYTILRELGSGGMGVVYEAEQAHPRRRVAVKVLRSSLLPRSVVRRFRAEADILARLQHPHIARVLEAGWHDTGAGGVPWFAMELVEDARRLTEYANDEGLDTRSRLELFAVVCDAVFHGHRQGFVHRDLKPGNILVDGAGRPRIIDFGVARATDADTTLATLHTESGELVGTLRYMSPEQCAGDPNAVDTRSDLYALGVVLHELLTGEMPYDLSTATTAFDIPRVIRDSDPRRLSSFDASLRGDLETIVLKCLEKDPERRYATVGDLAADVRHYLAGEAIAAKRDNGWYVLRKTVRRHGAAAAVAAAFLVLGAVALVTVSVLWTRAEQRAEELRRRDYVNSIALARNALEENNVSQMLDLLDRCPPDLRGWEWWHVRARADDSVEAIDTGFDVDTTSWPWAFQFHGERAAICGLGGQIQVWNLATRDLERTIEAGRMVWPRFSPDGSLLAARAWEDPSPHEVWDVRTGERLLRTESRVPHGEADFSPDNARYLHCDGGSVVIREIATGGLVHRIALPAQASIVRVSPDGGLIATGSYDGVLRLWRGDTFELVDESAGHRPWISGLEFGPDSSRIVLATSSGLVREYDLGRRSVTRTVEGLGSGACVAVSPGGSRYAAASKLAIRVWRADTGETEAVLRGGGLIDPHVSFLTDRRIVAGSMDGRVLMFDLASPAATGLIVRDTVSIDVIAVSPDGRWLAAGPRRREIVLRNAGDGSLVRAWPAHVNARRLWDLRFSPDGSLLASAGEEATVRLWRVPGGEMGGTLECDTTRVLRLGWTPDGSVLFAACSPRTVEAWDVARAARLATLELEPLPEDADWFEQTRPIAMAVAPTGDRLATSGASGRVHLWSWPGLAPIGSWPGHRGPVYDVAFSPDGRLLATASHDGTTSIWDAARGARRHTLRHADGRGRDALFTPRGDRLLTGSVGGSLQLWDVSTGEPVFSIDGGDWAPQFDSTGERLFAAGADQVIRVWTAPGYAQAR